MDRTSKLLRRQRIKTIFHLAAQAIVGKSYAAPATTLDTNVRGTWLVLEAARHSTSVEEIVVASSDKAYGSHDRLPYTEDFALQGKNPYDCSKSCADLIAQMYAHSYQLPVAILRCANIYGGGDLNWSRLVPDALRCAFTGKTLVIRSNKSFQRDYLYVEDAVDGYLRLAERLRRQKLEGQAFNLGSSKPVSLLEVIALAERVTGAAITSTSSDSAHHEIKQQCLDARKAARVLGWKPRTAPASGFKKTADWYRTYFARIRCPV